jgi:hypothetical protein
MLGQRKPDEGLKNGISRSLNAAFAPDSPVDPTLRNLIDKADGTYLPDEAADRRASHLLERLKKLPWGQTGQDS